MPFLMYFLQYAFWAVEAMILPPFCILLLLSIASLLWARRRQQPLRKQLWRPAHWWVATQILFFAAPLLIGILLPYDHQARAIRYRADYALYAVFYGSLISAAYWIWRMKGFRWFAASLMGILECPILGAIFIAAMSVTGDWL